LEISPTGELRLYWGQREYEYLFAVAETTPIRHEPRAGAQNGRKSLARYCIKLRIEERVIRSGMPVFTPRRSESLCENSTKTPREDTRLQETAEPALSCRPGHLTERIFKQAPKRQEVPAFLGASVLGGWTRASTKRLTGGTLLRQIHFAP